MSEAKVTTTIGKPLRAGTSFIEPKKLWLAKLENSGKKT